jgi:hypothetical protein
MGEVKRSLLNTISFQLFGGEKPNISHNIIMHVLKEAEAQTVFSLAFAYLQKELTIISAGNFDELNEKFYRNVILNTNNFQEHNELHDLMESRQIPYVTIKGLASAYYYPDPSLRDMGDVDFLVFENDFESSKRAVLSAGFKFDHGDEEDSIHIAFKREPVSIWEQHRCVNGIPEGSVGELIREELDKTIETSKLVELDGAVCRIPDKFHHGLIMLLHMISHMTSEGIGLRHLCDWAVFVNSISNNEFVGLFSEKLNSFGLWKFAQIMTATSEKYLRIEHKEWIESAELDDDLLEDVITDILNGGNFGKKDLNRYREIKYISNRNERTVDSKSVLLQAFDAVNKKACDDFRFIGKHRLLLPIGWLAEGGKYFGLLVTGKRKSKGTSKMLKEAAKRKNIYSTMELFVDNQKI